MAPAADFFKKYQARAGAEGVDPLGYYLGGWGYAYINVLGEAIDGDQERRTTTRSPTICARQRFKTIMGDWSYGANGEWTKSGMMQVQYHDIKDGAGLELEGHELPDRADADRPDDRQGDLSLREGEVSARSCFADV